MQIQIINNKIYTEIYKAKSEYFSFFQFPHWFLGLTKDTHILACYNKSEIIAIWPIHITKRFGLIKCLLLPSLVSNGGPVFLFNPDDILSKQLTGDKKKTKIVRAFIEKLDDFNISYSAIDLNPSYNLVQVFHFNGYRLNYKHNYYIPNDWTCDKVLSEMDTSTRRKLKNLLGINRVEPSTNYLGFVQMVKSTFDRKKIPGFPNASILAKVVKESVENNTAYLFEQRNAHNEVIAYGFFPKDHERLYYLIGAFDLEKANGAIVNPILWKGIELSRELCLVFDFEGTMLEDIDVIFANFGARKEPYVQIEKTKGLILSVLLAINKWRKSRS